MIRYVQCVSKNVPIGTFEYKKYYPVKITKDRLIIESFHGFFRYSYYDRNTPHFRLIGKNESKKNKVWLSVKRARKLSAIGGKKV